jgi:hypothetical protein
MPSTSPNIILRSDLKVPFDLEAIVVEEDTGMILSADTNIRTYDEHPIRLMTSLLDQKSETPGNIVTRGESPFLFYAIVHDFDQYPSFKEDWVSSAIALALEKCSPMRVQSLAMQVLGATYGTRSESWFLDLLTNHVRNHHDDFPARILVLN